MSEQRSSSSLSSVEGVRAPCSEENIMSDDIYQRLRKAVASTPYAYVSFVVQELIRHRRL